MATEKTNGPLARAECESNGRETKQRNGNNSSDQSQRINPVNLPAERSVLGALIEDDSLKADVLAPDYDPPTLLFPIIVRCSMPCLACGRRSVQLTT